MPFDASSSPISSSTSPFYAKLTFQSTASLFNDFLSPFRHLHRLSLPLHYPLTSLPSPSSTSSLFRHPLTHLRGFIKVWSTVKIRGTRVPQKAIVPVGRPRPYSIIILNMRFIPKASLRASSQITARSYILERHL